MASKFFWEEKKMRSNQALLKNLKSLSSFFKKLVNYALKEKIFIITLGDYFRYIPQRLVKSQIKECEKKTMAATRIPDKKENALKRIIAVRWPEFKKVSQWPELKDFKIPDDDLMIMELCFSHEIAHNLIWEQRAPCSRTIFSHPPRFYYFHCAYFEIMAWCRSLEIINELNPKIDFRSPDFSGRYASYFSALQFIDVFNILERQSKICTGLGLYQMKGCPKGGEIHRLIENAEMEWLESWRK